MSISRNWRNCQGRLTDEQCLGPYQGKLGVVEEGALADLLLVEGDPIANIRLIEDPERNFRVIMKDGMIYKNLVGAGK